MTVIQANFDSDTRPVNPRAFLAARGEAEFAARLRERAGYVPQSGPLQDFFEAMGAEMPLLAEGGRGSGKTAFGEAVATAFNMPYFYLQCVPGLTIKEVLYTTDGTEGRLTRENIHLCDFLAAYEHCAHNDTIPLLLIDEVDKTSVDIENMMLQALGRRYAHIPRLQPNSIIGIEDKGRPGPVVILTSNNMRELSEPLRSRCIYTYFRNPTPEEEVAVMRSQVPGASAELLKQCLKVFHYIRTINSISSHPGLRESIAFAQALVRKGVRTLDAETVRRHLCYIGRNHPDREALTAKVTLMVTVAARQVPEIDRRVERAFSSATVEVFK